MGYEIEVRDWFLVKPGHEDKVEEISQRSDIDFDPGGPYGSPMACLYSGKIDAVRENMIKLAPHLADGYSIVIGEDGEIWAWIVRNGVAYTAQVEVTVLEPDATLLSLVCQTERFRLRLESVVEEHS